MRRCIVRSLAIASLLVPTFAFGQATSTPTSVGASTVTTSTSAVRPSTVISVNPFLPLAGYFQGEFERRLRDNLAFAIGASHVWYGEGTTNVDAKLRLYPQEKAPYGLGLAAGLGMGHQRVTEYTDVACLAIGCPQPGRTVVSKTSPALSMEIHYQWMLGRKQNTAVGFGFGAKRYVSGGPFPEFVPTGRLTIGYAFGR